MLNQAVQSMHEVKDIGESEKEEDPRRRAHHWRDGGFYSRTRKRRCVIALIGETANGAMTFYDIVHDPVSAPMSVFGMLLGATSLPRTAESFWKMGDLRVKMEEGGNIGKMGKVFHEDSNNISKILNGCKKSA
ncbi:hypothetical protein PT974_05733 [Cladobotryum mycophilum]|uniref:Uncharacterized protein n=1 Tax=Cladobotryum mycophilum TaxID=491253 RepID=A0ABR0SKQ6_9HYPO